MDRQKILVVDDENRMRKLVKDFLQRENFEVLEAGDGSEALDVFFAHQDIALIILDVMMPKMDGWQVCREIRSYSKVPIIMLTARSDEKRRFCAAPVKAHRKMRYWTLEESIWTKRRIWWRSTAEASI